MLLSHVERYASSNNPGLRFKENNHKSCDFELAILNSDLLDHLQQLVLATRILGLVSEDETYQ